MADPKNELQEALHRFVKDRQVLSTFPAQVKAVNETDYTCDVVDSDELEIYDVRLRATVDGVETGAILVPKVGSWVIVANVGNSEGEYVVIASSELTKVVLQVGTANMEIAADGIQIERNAQNLKEVLNILLDAIKAITVTCASPGMPSTIPVNFAAFDAVKTQINQILK